MEIQQILFLIFFLVVIYLAIRLYGRVYRNIHLGQPLEISGQTGRRWRNVFLVAFGQGKMFTRWIPAVFHLFIYLAFLITQVELLEIMVDGIFGKHRFFAPYLGAFYTFIISSIEILSLLALLATVIFLVRRNILKTKRFTNDEMKGWPSLDANIILLGEIVLILGIFLMNGSDLALQQLDPDRYPETGAIWISSMYAPAIFEDWNYSLLVLMERTGWWLHIVVVFGFLLYLPVSKHLHILLAFPNTYYAKLASPGKMINMSEVMEEVQSILGIKNPDTQVDNQTDIPEFGANDVFTLNWKNLLDAYTCTECGRCTAVCPANITGKKLSPRKIMMDVRDRAEEVGRRLDSGDPSLISAGKEDARIVTKENYSDGKDLFNYILPEELHACTSCMACIEACPVLIDPLDIIQQLRRYEILTLASGPDDWIPMFTSVENKGVVWQMPQERDDWTKQF